MGGKALISFCFDDFKAPGLIKQLEKCADDSDFENVYGESAFILMYARALCEFQGGRLTLTRLPSETKALITVMLPASECPGEASLEEPGCETDYTGKAFSALAGIIELSGEG
jgi:hypothetical protein